MGAARIGALVLLACLLAAPAFAQTGTSNPNCIVDPEDRERPIAIAGKQFTGPPVDSTTQFEATEGERVQLDGSASCDAQGDPMAFHWMQVEGPPVGLDSASFVRPAFTSPLVPDGYHRPGEDVPGNIRMTFRLVVEAGGLVSNPSDVVVVVNGRPIPDAGNDSVVEDHRFDSATRQIVPTVVTLNGTGSHDPVGEPLLYRWRQVSGIQVLLSNDQAPEPTFLAPATVDGQLHVLEFLLDVEDVQMKDGVSQGTKVLSKAPDRVQVTVIPFNPAPTVTLRPMEVTAVDLIDDAGETIPFEAAAIDDRAVHSVFAVLTAGNTGARIEVPLFPGPDQNLTAQAGFTYYRGSLPVNDPRFGLNVRASGQTDPWKVSGLAYDAAGKANTTADGEELFLDVTAAGAKDAFPTLRVVEPGLQPVTPPCPTTPTEVPARVLGPGDTVRFSVCIQPFLLHSKLTYQSQLPDGAGGTLLGQEVELPAPFTVGTEALAGGNQTLIVRAYDRVGHVARMDVPAVVDLGDPEALLVPPELAYRGLPFDLLVFVHDDTDREVSMRIAGQDVRLARADAGVVPLPRLNRTNAALVATQLVALLPPGVVLGLLNDDADGGVESFLRDDDTRVYRFQVTVNGPGVFVVEVTVLDDAGNRIDRSTSLEVVQAVTDLEVLDARVLVTKLLPGEEARFTANVRQRSGVASVPSRVVFEVDGTEIPVDADVPLATQVQVGPVNGTFLPGQHTLRVVASPAESVRETDFTNQQRTATFEVFIGKTLSGSREYFIRVNDQGFPLEAVSPEGRAYPVALNQTGDQIRYDFSVAGALLYWDPLERDEEGRPVTEVAAEAEVSEKSTPLPPLAPAVALLLAALLRRRRA